MTHNRAVRRVKSKVSNLARLQQQKRAVIKHFSRKLYGDEAANIYCYTAIYTVSYALMTTLIIPVHVQPVLYCVCVFFLCFCMCFVWYVYSMPVGVHTLE